MARGFRIILVLSALAAVWSCRPGKAAGGERRLSLAISSRFERNFDPHRDSVMTFQPLFSLMYDSLFRMDTGMQPRPWLVERYERYGRAVNFELKANLRFCDGRPITSADVVASIQRSLRVARTPNPIYRDIVGGEDFVARRADTLSGLQVLTPRSFRIEFRSDNREFPYYLAAPVFAILPAGWSPEQPTGSGLYCLRSYSSDESRSLVRLRRNPHYHVAVDPGIDELTVEFYSRDADFVAAILGERVDAYFNFLSLSLGNVPAAYRPHRTPILGGFYISLNPRSGNLADPEVRRWLASRFDFDTLLQSRRWDIVSPSHRVLPYGLPEYFLFRPMVRQPAAERNFPQPWHIRAVNMQSSIRPELLEFMRAELARNNVLLDLEWDNYQVVQERTQRGDFGLTSFFFLTDVPLAIHFYELLFTPGLELNTDYVVPEAQQLLAAYRQEGDERRRLGMLARLEEIARRESFLVPVFNPVATLGYRKPLGRLSLNYLLQFDLGQEGR